MSATQPIKCVQELGKLSSNNATKASGNPYIVKTGILYIAVTTTKEGGAVGTCNTSISQVGMSSIHVNKQSDMLLRYGHPAQGVVVGVTTGASTVLQLNHPDTKIRVGDFVTVIGSSVTAYNTVHKQVTAVSSPQQWNDYTQTITVNYDTSTAGAFVGVATVAKSVIPVLFPETSSGCDAYIQEVQLG